MTTPPILVVDDSDDDFYVLTRVMREVGLRLPLHRCPDAESALEYLASTGASEQAATRPAFILIDLNLPGMDGRALLRQLKEDARWRSIPMVVYTTSDNPRDIAYCYAHHANSYHVKPMDIDELYRSLRGIADYWLQLVRLPSGSEDSP